MVARTSVIPCLVYEDAPRAIDFLCEAFGFARHLVVPGETERDVAHAQLRLGDSMVMLSSAKPDHHERFGLVTAQATNGLVTGSIYVMVADPDAHHAQAVAYGASVIIPPRDNEYGGRGYEVRDCEGCLWSFGSYDPWQA